MSAPKPEARAPLSRTYFYPHEPVRRKMHLVLETYEYDMPFKYENIVVNRWLMPGREAHGVELGVINQVPREGLKDPESLPADEIVITEPHPIVRVAVIGSACTPPGYVQVECEPVAGWRNDYETHSAMPVRFRAENLWGMHLRFDALLTATPGVEAKFRPEGAPGYEAMPERIKDLYPSTRERPWHTKTHARENPLAGMSCAVFEVPPSLRVRVSGGSASTGWSSDNCPTDNHYSFRLIRTTVQLRKEPVG